ncbi:hypothetical protein [Streptomyces sp. NPDC090445]|uniref:hypothetical protein n=1 Tax=Streptomyces sp. NPDC090445 TaxID=3365963 RepID=UPI00380E5B4B
MSAGKTAEAEAEAATAVSADGYGPDGQEPAPRYTVSAAEAQRIADEQMAQVRQWWSEQVAALPQADQEEIEELPERLGAWGIEVNPVARWWGVEIHLNAEAADSVADITEEIGRMVPKVPKLAPWRTPTCGGR